MRQIEIKYDIGAIVYLKTDPDQIERIVTGIMMRPIGIMYYLSAGDNESVHFDIEINRKKNVLKSLS